MSAAARTGAFLQPRACRYASRWQAYGVKDVAGATMSVDELYTVLRGRQSIRRSDSQLPGPRLL